MITESRLTTIDNPYDPFDDFTHWLLFDNEKGYNTCGRLARIAKFSDDMTEREEFEETDRAIDEIIKYDPIGIYQKVTRDVQNEPDEAEVEDI